MSLHRKLMFLHWKHKLSPCKNTLFSRFHKIIFIVFRAIYHRIVPQEGKIYKETLVSD